MTPHTKLKQPPIEVAEQFLTRPEAADYLRLSVHTLGKMASLGGGPRFTKLGKKVGYRRSDLETWIRSRTFDNTSQYGRATGDDAA